MSGLEIFFFHLHTQQTKGSLCYVFYTIYLISAKPNIATESQQPELPFKCICNTVMFPTFPQISESSGNL